MGVASPPEGGRAKNSFNLGTSLASTLGLDPDHISDRGTSPKTTTVSPERGRERTVPECREERASSLVH